MSYSQSPTNSVSLVKLVCWQKWYHLDEILELDDNQDTPVFDDRLKNQLPEEHILHLACQYQAPPKTLELLSKKFPQSVSCAENKGRYPLHIACAKGLKPKAIDFLIKSYPQAAVVQDDFGKAPLHYVGESYAYNFRTTPSNAYRSPTSSILTVVSLLLDVCPESANVEDLYGMNAIEYALDSDTSIKVIKLMQNKSRENWRTLSSKYRDKSHDELLRSITSLGSSFNSLNLPSENLQSMTEQDPLDDDRADLNIAKHIDRPEKKVRAARTA